MYSDSEVINICSCIVRCFITTLNCCKSECMKRKSLVLLSIIVIIITLFSAIVFSACKNKAYTISYYVGDELWGSKTVASNSSDFMIDGPQNTNGYIFEGWYFDNNIWKEEFTNSHKITSNINVYAKYLYNGEVLTSKFKITYIIDGISSYSREYAKGTTPQLDVPSVENKIFDQWFVDSMYKVPYQSKVIENNFVLYGKWKEVQLADVFEFDKSSNTIMHLKPIAKNYTYLNIPSKIEHVDVKHIGLKSFMGSNVVNINIENGIETIGESAFFSCEKLTRITLPSSVSKIDKNAFNSCSSLERIYFPEKLSVVNEGVFKNCSALSVFNFTTSLTKIMNSAFENTAISSVVIPKTVKSVGNQAFIRCKKLYSVIVQNGVELLDNEAFAECSNLDSIVFEDLDKKTPNLVIKDHVFKMNAKLTKVDFPDYVTSIGKGAFEKATNLETVKLPLNDSFKHLSTELFYQATKLKNINLPISIESIGHAVFFKTSIESIEIPSKVTELKNSVFSECEYLQKVVLNNVTTLGPNCFESCFSLDDIDISKISKGYIRDSTNPDGQEQIEGLSESLFLGCRKLGAISLSENIKIISKDTFRDCSMLIIKNTDKLINLKEIGESSFKNANSHSKFYLSSNVSTIGKDSFYIFCQASPESMENSFTIYTSHNSKQDGWSDGFMISTAKILYNKSTEDFNNA